MDETTLHDFFISYKRKDSEEFATELAKRLKGAGYNVWFDEFSLKPGDSVTRGIEQGLRHALVFVLLLTENYFSGWSDQERLSAFNQFVAAKRKIVPIWYGVEADFIGREAPLLSDIKAIRVSKPGFDKLQDVVSSFQHILSPGEQRSKIAEVMLRALHRAVPNDPNVAIFIAVFENNTEMLERAVEAGANVNITDAAVINYHHKLIVKLGLSDVLARFLILNQRPE